MANLTEDPAWVEGIYQLEQDDLVLGGPDGIDNLQAKQLARRTAYLKQQIESAQGGLSAHEAASDPHPAYLTSAEGDAKVAAAVAALIASSPATLDTLAELATALGNDPDFATTVTNALAAKATPAGVQAQTYTAFTTTGAAGAFVLTPAPALTAYAAGQRFRAKFHIAGTGADVINVNALGNKSIKQYDTSGAKVAAVIAVGQLADIEYDGVDFVVLDPLPPALMTAMPIGSVVHVAQSSAPTGYLKANGTAVSRTAYAALFAVIGTTFGGGDGITTFNVPDLRGEFIRGLDDGRGVDSGRVFGSAQAATEIYDRIDNAGSGYVHVTNSDGSYVASGTFWAAGVSGQTTSSVNKIRPRNVALLACIKY